LQLIIALTAKSNTEFSKVVQAHALGEVSILGTVLSRLYSGTILPIFMEIGSYLTDMEQKKSWHSFFLRHVWAIYRVGQI